jgi:hypothetical protein
MQDKINPQESTLSTTNDIPKSAAHQRLENALYEKGIKTRKEAQEQCLEEGPLKASMPTAGRRHEHALVEGCITSSNEAQVHSLEEGTLEASLPAGQRGQEHEPIPSKDAEVHNFEESTLLVLKSSDKRGIQECNSAVLSADISILDNPQNQQRKELPQEEEEVRTRASDSKCVLDLYECNLPKDPASLSISVDPQNQEPSEEEERSQAIDYMNANYLRSVDLMHQEGEKCTRTLVCKPDFHERNHLNASYAPPTGAQMHHEETRARPDLKYQKDRVQLADFSRDPRIQQCNHQKPIEDGRDRIIDTAKKRQSWPFRSNHVPKINIWFGLLLAAVLFGLASATDCEVMNNFIPSLFNASGIACCSQTYVTCVDDRVTSIIITQANKVHFPNGLPESLGQLEFLEEFRLTSARHIHNVNVNSPFPQSFGNLTNLVKLSLNDCNLKGTLPFSLGNLIKLTSISLANNQLSGIVPASLISLQNLKTLNLGVNQLLGPIPQLSGKLSSCTLYPHNKFTCYHSENVACVGNNVQGFTNRSHFSLRK